MKKFDFGNYLYELRKKSGLTQRYVAYELDVTDKAVSKWEMSKSVPDLEKLKKLASLYNVSLDDLINKKDEKNISINKIVLTGGPCAGKTTALSWINNYFSKRGYKVITIPETATELIINGIAPWTCGTNYDYQLTNIKLQKEKEKIYEEVAKSMDAEKILLVCDRGVLDCKAYTKEVDFKRVLKELGTTEIEERDSYDAIFHLVTAAKGKEEVYKLDNNIARTETIEEARKVDDRIIDSWTGHPHLRIIDNSTDFEEKLERLLKEITLFLGEPEPLKIERKFLIRYPNIKELDSMLNCQKIDITQTYLKSENGVERRIRTRGSDDNYIYYLTEKKRISDLTSVETERRLSKDEYVSLLLEADTSLHVIHKTRYYLTENNQYFTIDIYPEWKNIAIMEIELNSEDEEFTKPSFVEIVKEVTKDETYKTYNMAKVMPKD